MCNFPIEMLLIVDEKYPSHLFVESVYRNSKGVRSNGSHWNFDFRHKQRCCNASSMNWPLADVGLGIGKQKWPKQNTKRDFERNGNNHILQKPAHLFTEHFLQICSITHLSADSFVPLFVRSYDYYQYYFILFRFKHNGAQDAANHSVESSDALLMAINLCRNQDLSIYSYIFYIICERNTDLFFVICFFPHKRSSTWWP